MSVDVEPTPAGALALLKAGQLDQAERACARLVQGTPHDPLAWALRARVLLASGCSDEAQAAVTAALRLDPNCIAAWLEQTALHKHLRQPAAAIAALKRLVELRPKQAELWLDLATLQRQQGNLAAARDVLQNALRHAPQHPEVHYQRAELAAASGDWEIAITHYRLSGATHGRHRKAAWRLGMLYRHHKRYADGLAHYQQWLENAPDDPEALEGLAHCLKFQGAPPSRYLPAYRQAAEHAHSARAWTQLAAEHQLLGDHPSARQAFDRALHCDPAWLTARWGRFQAPNDTVYADEAEMACFLDEWRAGLTYFEQLPLERADPGALAACITLSTEFYRHYLGPVPLEEQRRYGQLVERMMCTVAPAATVNARRAPGQRIRLGICSGMLRNHTMSKLFGPMLWSLDRTRFECSTFYLDDEWDTVSEIWRSHADHFMHGERPLQEWIAAIRARELDALLYLDIGMHPVIQGLCALRLAPVQAVLWGHPQTSGRSVMDYFVSARDMETEDAPSRYSERLVLLPRLGTCYQPPSLSPQVPPELSDRDPHAVHYFLAQQSVKLLPAHDGILARIAAQLPQARFHLTPSGNSRLCDKLRQRIRAAFHLQGLDFERHRGLFRFVSQAEFLGVAQTADVHLDSVGWSGGNTSLEIFWFNVPTVTLPGTNMRSRHTYAMLRLMELDELIARDAEDYVRIALELGRSTDFRLAMRQRIAERKHRLYEDREVAAALQAFLVHAVASTQPEDA